MRDSVHISMRLFDPSHVSPCTSEDEEDDDDLSSSEDEQSEEEPAPARRPAAAPRGRKKAAAAAVSHVAAHPADSAASELTMAQRLARQQLLQRRVQALVAHAKARDGGGGSPSGMAPHSEGEQGRGDEVCLGDGTGPSLCSHPCHVSMAVRRLLRGAYSTIASKRQKLLAGLAAQGGAGWAAAPAQPQQPPQAQARQAQARSLRNLGPVAARKPHRPTATTAATASAAAAGAGAQMLMRPIIINATKPPAAPPLPAPTARAPEVVQIDDDDDDEEDGDGDVVMAGAPRRASKKKQEEEEEDEVQVVGVRHVPLGGGIKGRPASAGAPVPVLLAPAGAAAAQHGTALVRIGGALYRAVLPAAAAGGAAAGVAGVGRPMVVHQMGGGAAASGTSVAGSGGAGQGDEGLARTGSSSAPAGALALLMPGGGRAGGGPLLLPGGAAGGAAVAVVAPPRAQLPPGASTTGVTYVLMPGGGAAAAGAPGGASAMLLPSASLQQPAAAAPVPTQQQQQQAPALSPAQQDAAEARAVLQHLQQDPSRGPPYAILWETPEGERHFHLVQELRHPPACNTKDLVRLRCGLVLVRRAYTWWSHLWRADDCGNCAVEGRASGSVVARRGRRAVW